MTGRDGHRPSKAGLVLLEVLIVGAILVVLAGAFLLSLTTGYNTHFSNDAYVQVQYEARRAVQTMVTELRGAGNVNAGVPIAEPGVQRLDFQLVRRYDAVAGPVWGSDTTDGAWLHYVVDTATPARLMRCATAGQLDAMPAGFAGCRVLANAVDPAAANTAFAYDPVGAIVTLRIRSVIVSPRLPGGQVGSGTSPLLVRVRLRNI